MKKKWIVMILIMIIIALVSCKAEVAVRPTAVSLDKERLTLLSLGINQSPLTVTVFPVDATNKDVIWSSNNMDVATVNSSGEIRTVLDGAAKIIVTTEDGGYTDECLLTVGSVVFVDPSGSTANSGLYADLPKGTIAHGITAAGEENRDWVFVARGTFDVDDQIDMVDGISLVGAYAADFFSRDLAVNDTIINDTRSSGITVQFDSLVETTVLDGFVFQGSSADAISTVIDIISCSPTIRNNSLFNRVQSEDTTFVGIHIKEGASPLIYNNLLVGDNGYSNYMIYITSTAANACEPKIYNNTIVPGEGAYRQWGVSVRWSTDSVNHHPYLKNNLFYFDNTFTGDNTINHTFYHMDSGTSHYPYCYTTNLIYLSPYNSGDGNYVYYSVSSSNNINQDNLASRTALINGGTAQILEYDDSAWRNIVNQNPDFVDISGDDYHLQSGSPAAASGTDLSGEIPAFDRDGNLRTVPWSIGAFEMNG